MRNIVVIDTETGGLDANVSPIFEFAAVHFEGASQGISFLINDWTGVVSQASMDIHGIEFGEIKEKGKTTQQACDIIDVLFGEPKPPQLAGHNIAFDLAFISRLYRLNKRQPPKSLTYRTIDTHSLLWLHVQKGDIPESCVSLSSALSYFEIEIPKERHRALADAIATRELLHKLLKL